MKNDADSLGKLKGRVEMEQPNKLIDNFSGVINLDGRGKVAILAQNVILRGCVVRNTDWVLGLGMLGYFR